MNIEEAVSKVEAAIADFDKVMADADDEWGREPGEMLTKWVIVGLWEKPDEHDAGGDSEQVVVYSSRLGMHAKTGLLTLGMQSTLDDFRSA